MSIGGWAAPEVERAYTRTRKLCEFLGDPPEVFPVLAGCFTYFAASELQTAVNLPNGCCAGQRGLKSRNWLTQAHKSLGQVYYYLAELLPAKNILKLRSPFIT